MAFFICYLAKPNPFQTKDKFRIFRRIIKRHAEAVHCLSFSPDSTILLTACNLGNVRISYMDSENEDADCSIDAAHDMGVLSTDFCKLCHSDR